MKRMQGQGGMSRNPVRVAGIGAMAVLGTATASAWAMNDAGSAVCLTTASTR
jgi:hypothetical protein